MALRVKMTNDRDYSAAIFNVFPHAKKGYNTISADLVAKNVNKSTEEKTIQVDRLHVYCQDLGFYESIGDEVPRAVASHFLRIMKHNQGNRITVKVIVEENEKKLTKPIIAVGVQLNSQE